MIKITKATEKKLQTYINEHYEGYNIPTILHYIVKQLNKEDGGTLFTKSAWINENGVSAIIIDRDMQNILRGLASKYESLVETTFTHGNGQITIKDMNKLVKLVLTI